jgi:hypothetical protein
MAQLLTSEAIAAGRDRRRSIVSTLQSQTQRSKISLSPHSRARRFPTSRQRCLTLDVAPGVEALSWHKEISAPGVRTMCRIMVSHRDA